MIAGEVAQNDQENRFRPMKRALPRWNPAPAARIALEIGLGATSARGNVAAPAIVDHATALASQGRLSTMRKNSGSP
ncbi:hypothetical protein CFN78_12760 [Amycolatopsis antarctica]|uniref:Uncharacterized protein n=1 Tax=Amycolatopsis antarctica TaxID=1854586 RepID=A0A263D3Z3_9PSEU|nr:hypothetical protein CFN78_12760 [Amycolatopsis antarctica]